MWNRPNRRASLWLCLQRSLVTLLIIGCQGGGLDFGEPPLTFELDACTGELSSSEAERACYTDVALEEETRACLVIKDVIVEVSVGPDGAVTFTPDAREIAEARVRYWGAIRLRSGLISLSAEGASDCEAHALFGDCDPALGCVARADFSLERIEDQVLIVQEGGEAECVWTAGTQAEVERCDGLDNDCDRLVDEGFNIGEACLGEGLGVCRQEGVIACAEEGQARCVFGGEAPLPSEERCDGLDHDCDGVSDESFAEQGQACEPTLGEGQPAVSAEYACREGALICPIEERCDGVDNDLDGEVDEGFAVGEVCEPVQDGCNSRAGRVQCVTLELLERGLGALGEATCVADQVMVGVEGAEGCDGLDQDCDGYFDEDFVEGQVSCGVGACTNPDGRRRCVAGEVVDDCVAFEGASTDDTCNGVDDDCDGLVDESFLSYLALCEGLSGECARSARVYCVNSEAQQSCPEVLPPVTTDLSCDGLDEDCDGVVDEDYAPQEVSCGFGVCRRTVESRCQEGVENVDCDPEVPLEDERDQDCDGQDDDCDGRVDEGYTPRVYTCFTGVCAQSFSTRCEVSAQGSTEIEECPATSLIQPQVERCDGLDNDCNGVIDDNAYAPVNTTCGLGVCERTGVEACVAGEIFDNCTPNTPSEGVVDDCDGLDNDCDGKVDEAFVSVEVTCEGAVECAEPGATICVAGQVSDTCSDVVDLNHPEDVCDGVDQDCDGEVDEGYIGQATSCGEGLCASTGVTFCQLGVEGDSCQPGVPTPDVSCDGFDQDCDGRVDEGYATTAVLCGQGECLNGGLRECANGEELTSCTPLDPSPDEDCNSKDDDCDGFVDEGYVASMTTCGVGVCERQGQQACTASGVQNNCVEGSPTGPDTSCDGVDQDCDGSVDEGYVGPEVVCGLGVCENQTRATCVDGAVQQHCEALNLASPDVNCNQVDEDCDGQTDEGFVGQVEQCGEGACEPTALQLCTQSGVVSTCSYQDSPIDQTCNGVDEDCDGSVDEDYVGPTTSETCGVGVCESDASVQCLQGSPELVCSPGLPQGQDEQCDGVDQDCDGQTDEAFSQTLTCGLGVCERTVTVGCDGSCTPGEPGAELCGDGLDNDCDGQVDEGFEELNAPCSVGVGACERTGDLRCQPQDLSAPLECDVAPGSPELERCDGLDNDCDGVIDEELGSAVVCLLPRFEGTSCERGQQVCEAGDLVCVGDVAPGELNENYCTSIDEDCDADTAAQVTIDTVTPAVYQGNTYLIRLGDTCGFSIGGSTCKWTCVGGIELSCRFKFEQCNPALITP